MRYTLSTLHRHKFSSSRGYTFVLTKISERSQVWYFVPANYLDAMWMVWLILLYVVYNCFDAYVSIAKLLLSWCYDSCYLKGFLDPVRFHFQGGFSFLTMLRWAKHSFGPVAPPVDHLRNRAWPCTGHCPSLFFLSIIRTTTPVVSFNSILCACVYVDVCDWLGLQCTLSWCDRCSNHANKNRFFVFSILCMS